MLQRKFWRLRGLGGRFIILQGRDLAPTEIPLSPLAAWRLIASILSSPQDATDLGTLASAMSPSGIGQPRQLNRVALEHAISNGTLVLLNLGAVRPNNPAAAPAVESVADQILNARVVKTWVEFELVDSAGLPVPGQAYTCVLPDGEIREGRLDAKGQVRFDGIDPGTCVFTFPELDGDVWQSAR